MLLLAAISCKEGTGDEKKTIVEIHGDKFLINHKPTYEGRSWKGYPVEGLLMNSRMVQGLFDDQNHETAEKWKYPDTGEWDPDRNTDEFVAAMDEWYAYGLLSFTINLQGGSPMGYGNEGWQNSAFDVHGAPRAAYFERLSRILKKADDLGMIPILGIFYFGQDQYLEGDDAIYAAIDYTMDWLFESGYRNVLIEVNNECNVRSWDHEILKDPHVHALISYVRSKEKDGYSFLAGTSYGGGAIPSPEVVEASDGLVAFEQMRITSADLIITDIFMPEKDGILTIKEVKKYFPATKIIAISGGGRFINDNVDYLQLAIRLGAKRTFTKPLDVDKLLDAIKELLE